jgi:hypothetical protein
MRASFHFACVAARLEAISGQHSAISFELPHSGLVMLKADS